MNVLRLYVSAVAVVAGLGTMISCRGGNVRRMERDLRCGMSVEEVKRVAMEHGFARCGAPTAPGAEVDYGCSADGTTFSFQFDDRGLVGYEYNHVEGMYVPPGGKSSPYVSLCVRRGAAGAR